MVEAPEKYMSLPSIYKDFRMHKKIHTHKIQYIICLTNTIKSLPLRKYWIGQKLRLGFSITSYTKTQMNILANPRYMSYISHQDKFR